MSLWKEAKPEDIEIDYKNKEIEILTSSDHNGNNYTTIKFSLLWSTCDKIEEYYRAAFENE